MIRKIKNPNPVLWENLCQRATIESVDLQAIVKNIFDKVGNEKDIALVELTARFDKVELKKLLVSEEEIRQAEKELPQDLKDAIGLAYQNIRCFHQAQKEATQKIETMVGVTCWRESRAIERVGMYIPGGSAPLFSTVLMLGVPAQIAGCQDIVLCTPPNQEGNIHPAILYSASLVGVTKICKVGGSQAIAAMSLGTETVPKVNKIFGPGNQYVTAAKQYAQTLGIAIDMPAGPSEVLIIADATANPIFVAADLLAQAEHGEDSQVILLADNEQIIDATINEIAKQIEQLPRQNIAAAALQNSKAILLENIEECFEFSNLYAPEHLILAADNAAQWTSKIVNAGSVFVGNYSCESAGDYASGTNHTLPTNAYAKAYSGVSLDSFLKKITFQEITAQGIKNIGRTIEIMAAAEGLDAHKNAVTVRMQKIKNQ